ncbi:uncharacterized protein LOC105261967 [Musca domestica]|uniref:Uncharacterized protein LOC105261967 n=1 Tax=Musca domestica TaxID=7370 RepID=A0A9J7D9R9_MUSDO|nr:uncharacterized protein LOC105261967 [Musca domestica]
MSTNPPCIIAANEQLLPNSNDESLTMSTDPPKQSHCVIADGKQQLLSDSNNTKIDKKPITAKKYRRRKVSNDVCVAKEYLQKMSVRGMDSGQYKLTVDGITRCLVCAQNGIEKSFTSQYSFQRHAYLLHSGIRKIFACPICNAEFSRPDKMKYHKRTKHGVEAVENQINGEPCTEKENSQPKENTTKNQTQASIKKEEYKLPQVVFNSTLTLADGSQLQVSVPNVLTSNDSASIAIKEEFLESSVTDEPQLQYTTLANVAFPPTQAVAEDTSQNYQIIGSTAAAATDHKEVLGNLNPCTINQAPCYMTIIHEHQSLTNNFQPSSFQLQSIKIEDDAPGSVAANLEEFIKIPALPQLQTIKTEDVSILPNVNGINLPNGCLQAIQVGSLQHNANLGTFTVLLNNQLLHLKQQ